MTAIAKQCARSTTVPLNLGCCAFAGDRGLLFPELTAAATKQESTEVNSHEYGGYYSSNIPCEMGMSEGTGKNYVSIVYLVERASGESAPSCPNRDLRRALSRGILEEFPNPIRNLT
jgi:D-lactate dehydrogenase